MTAGGSSTRGLHLQDPPSFSAFHSTPPDAAVRKSHTSSSQMKHSLIISVAEYLYPTPGTYLPSTSQILNTKVAAGGRQPSPHSPTTTVGGSSHVRAQYRDRSPFPTSSSPSPSNRSRTESGSKSRTPSPTSPSAVVGSQLVPLEYLQNISLPRRDPVDEQLLRRFSTQSVSPGGIPRYGRGSGSSTPTSPVSPSAQSAPRHRQESGWDMKAR